MARKSNPEVDPIESLQQAVEATPPNIEKAQTAFAEVAIALKSKEDRVDYARRVSALAGQLAVKLAEAGAPLSDDVKLQAEISGKEQAYSLLADALEAGAEPQEAPTQTKGKKQTGGKS